jgi:LysM repeat protein
MTPTKTHPVARGETLSSIAKLYSVDVHLLAKENGIVNINKLREKQIIKIPGERLRNSPPAVAPKSSPPAPAKKGDVKTFSESAEAAFTEGKAMAVGWLDELLHKLRTISANEHVQKKESVPVPKHDTPPAHTPVPPRRPGSRSNRGLSDVKAQLKEKLGREPHVVVFNGVKLTENEKKQIVASVALCEMNADGFGSMNADQEFVGRKYGARGIGGLTYSRIVHIGLSYGVIQYTQDSGSLGKVLQKMYEKNADKFVEIFGGGDRNIAASLITLTNAGRPDTQSNANIPLSGQAYWNSIRKKDAGKELIELANGRTKSDLPESKEIRGKRVQPIPAVSGGPALDIWKGEWQARFLAAGKVIDFQEAQLEFAVSEYFNHILPSAKKHKVRSAMALGLIAACTIRGGVGSGLSSLFYNVAKELKIALPFANSDDEKTCFDAIAAASTHHNKVGDVDVPEDESRRARLLRNDEIGFLTEDLYDISTYG